MELSERFDTALAYAARLHRTQVRKGTRIPYVSHLLVVAGSVLEDGGDEDEAIAALLHDAIEDHGGGDAARLKADIAATFGDRVLDIVLGCTDTDQLPKPPWRQRKEAYLQHLRSVSPSVARVAAADKLHNARATLADYRVLGEDLWIRFNADKAELLWYHTAVAEELMNVLPESSLVQELQRVVETLARLAGGDHGSNPVA